MTGAVAAYERDAWAGIQIAMEMTPDVLGKKVGVVVADTKSDKIVSTPFKISKYSKPQNNLTTIRSSI